MKPTSQRSQVGAALSLCCLFAAGLVVAAGLAGCSPPPAPPPSTSTTPQPEQPAPSVPSSDHQTAKAPEATPLEAPSVAPHASYGAVTFPLQPRQGVMASLVNYYKPLQVSLSEKAEEQLVKEPQYASPKPLYGTLQLGEGPDNRITLVVDEPEGQKPRIYIDRNNDQDLTNDGSGEWTNDAGPTLTLSELVIDVPYGTAKVPYTFQFYRFKDRLRKSVLYYRDGGREGEITSEGKPYKSPSWTRMPTGGLMIWPMAP